MFHIIQDAYCITRNKRGVHRQTKVYQYAGGVYINFAGGYVRLLSNGNVGTPDCSYLELVMPDNFKVTKDKMGRLQVEPNAL